MSWLIVNQPLLPVSPPVPDGRLRSSRTGALAARLRGAIEQRTARVGVIGLGYVGLPLVELFAGKGFPVLGFDIDPKVERLQAGRELHRPHRLGAGRPRCGTAAASRRRPTSAGCARPTPSSSACRPRWGRTASPTCSAVIATGRTIAEHLRPGQLVVLESTTYPGTTRDVLRPDLEAGGLAAGRDFFLAYSPEREDPGNPRLLGPRHPQGRRRLGRGQRRAGRGAVRRGRAAGRARLQPARSPRPARSSRTPTAPSTSPWSTS